MEGKSELMHPAKAPSELLSAATHSPTCSFPHTNDHVLLMVLILPGIYGNPIKITYLLLFLYIMLRSAY